jgi:regulator of protease activity HflC (stomatin/prohibitin superfamily)
MKKVRINKGKVGLVYKNNDYKRVLKPGVYWFFGFNVEVVIVDLTQQFYVSNSDYENLIQDEELVELLEVVEVKDSELVLIYEKNNFNRVLESGRHLFWKGTLNRKFQKIDLNMLKVSEELNSSIFQNVELNKYIRLFEVETYEKAVLLIDDVYKETLKGGIYKFWRNGSTIKISKVDMRQLQLEVSGQELLTKDKSTIRVNFDLQYKVIDVEKALLENKAYEKQLYVTMQLALRSFIGKFTLDELLEKKEAIADFVFNDTKILVEALGVKILNCGIKDIILTGEMKEIMNQVLVAQKKAQANVITRREETAATRSLLNTAKLMEGNEMLFKLKEMEYVEKIADKVGEISVSGNGNMVKQLKEIFSGNK